MTRPTRDAAWHDAQYNSRGRIPEHPQILQSWAERSRSARDTLKPRVDLRYGDGEREALDLFLPAGGREPRPLLVWVHGGYWRALDKQSQSFVAEPYVAAGAAVALVGYALCPAVTVPHIVLQVARALAWLHVQAPRLGLDRRRVVVAGHSAGAQLAAMMLCCRWPDLQPGLPAQWLRGAVALSGVYDLEPLRHAPFLAPDLGLDEATARRLSPLRLPAPAAPLHAYVGGDESEAFKEQTRRLARAWGPVAVPVAAAVPGRHHMGILDEMVRPGSPVQRSVLGLLGLGPA